MRAVIFICFVLHSIKVFPQHTITGRVKDAVNNEPLQYAVIGVKAETGPSVNSDKEGYFQLSVSQTADSLVVSIIGYRSQSIAINGMRNPLNIQMDRGPVDLNAVTITAQSN